MTPAERLKEIELQHGALQFYEEQGYPAETIDWLIARVKTLTASLDKIVKLDDFIKENPTYIGDEWEDNIENARKALEDES